jgi:hypothetical protein
MAAKKEYLGDSVYVEFDGFGLTLTTENGNPYCMVSNTIYLEGQVYQALLDYVRNLKPERTTEVSAAEGQ